jgi:hypothetical protein
MVTRATSPEAGTSMGSPATRTRRRSELLAGVTRQEIVGSSQGEAELRQEPPLVDHQGELAGDRHEQPHVALRVRVRPVAAEEHEAHALALGQERAGEAGPDSLGHDEPVVT